MRLYKRSSTARNTVLSACVFVLILCLFWYGFSRTSSSGDEQSLEVTRTAVQKSIANCYATEGAYPPNIKYLEDHYGIMINHDKYVVQYELSGSNVMPSFNIIQKGSD